MKEIWGDIMNSKGFTLIELLATLVVLGIIMGIVLISSIGIFGNAKDETEDIFISTIEDAMNIYLDSDAKSLTYSNSVCTINKTHKTGVNVYKANEITIKDVIDSKYHPLTESDLVNPANKEVKCNINATISIYRDDDFIYYYKIDKDGLGCLNNDGFISNLPEGCNE